MASKDFDTEYELALEEVMNEASYGPPQVRYQHHMNAAIAHDEHANRAHYANNRDLARKHMSLSKHHYGQAMAAVQDAGDPDKAAVETRFEQIRQKRRKEKLGRRRP